MQFKDIRNGNTIYIVNRKEVSVSVAKVTNVSAPHFDNRMVGSAKMVVDISVESDGKNNTYVMDDVAESAYVGDMVITASRDSVLREIECIKTSSEQSLSMVDYHNDALEKCKKLLIEYSPEYRERTETTARIDAMESKIDKIAESLSIILNREGGVR